MVARLGLLLIVGGGIPVGLAAACPSRPGVAVSFGALVLLAALVPALAVRSPLPRGMRAVSLVCLVLIPAGTAVVTDSRVGVGEAGQLMLVLATYAVALWGLTALISTGPLSPAVVCGLVSGVAAAGLWAPYLLTDWIVSAADEAARGPWIRTALLVSPWGVVSDLLGHDWLRGSESYERSVIGSRYFFRYPTWTYGCVIYGGSGVTLGGLVLLARTLRLPLKKTRIHPGSGLDYGPETTARGE